MRMLKKYVLARLLMCFFALTNSYAATSDHIPADLIFDGKPIDSLCFFENEGKDHVVDLTQCGLKKDKYTIKGVNAGLSNKGYLGYDWQDPSISQGAPGYSYYRYFDAGNKQYWIYSVNSGGGSGEFTSIYLVRRQNANTLVMKDIVGGDRCNGGVQDVVDKHNRLSFSVNLTPYDFISMAEKKISNIKAYDDLAACAACCVAKAFYSIDTGLNLRFTVVDFGNNTPMADMPDQGKYQSCFNKVYQDYIAKNGTLFTQAKINGFAYQFNKICKHG